MIKHSVIFPDGTKSASYNKSKHYPYAVIYRLGPKEKRKHSAHRPEGWHLISFSSTEELARIKKGALDSLTNRGRNDFLETRVVETTL